MIRALLLTLVFGFFCLASARPCLAEPSDALRTEARERFDRGLRLFNHQDNTGALAEFTRAYELVPHPLVLYNIGLVHAALGAPVQAVDAFDELLRAPTSLPADKLSRVQEERARQAVLIAEIEVVCSVDAAIVEIDGVEIGKTPLAAPLRTSSGTHVIGVVAPGYAPSRKSLTVAGQTRSRLEFELVAQTSQLAHLTLSTRVPGADVFVDGERVGVTPLPASLALLPGTRRIELRRAGYNAAQQTLTLGSGSSGSIELHPSLDPQALAQEGGELALNISEPSAVVFIDGESRGQYLVPLRLPAGEHHLRVERSDFFPFERHIQVPRGGRVDVPVELEPTPEKRARYRASAQQRRTWSIISLSAGVALAAGGGGFLIWNHGEKDDAKQRFERQALRHEDGGDCSNEAEISDSCITQLNLTLENLQSTRRRDAYGWVGVGVGAAALGTGLVLLFTGDDPNRYEPRPESDVFGKLRLRPFAWMTSHGGGIAAFGSF